MDKILSQFLLQYDTEFPELIEKNITSVSREIIAPYVITSDKRGLNVKIIREDLLKLVKRISQKLSNKLSRKITSTEDTIKISCSEHHIETVSEKIESLFTFLLTCKCGEKEARYVKRNFYCNACGYIISSSIKFSKTS